MTEDQGPFLSVKQWPSDDDTDDMLIVDTVNNTVVAHVPAVHASLVCDAFNGRLIPVKAAGEFGWLSQEFAALEQVDRPLPWNDRGFLTYLDMPTTYGPMLHFTESSAADGPHAWLRITDPSAHLNRQQVLRLVRAAVRWLDDHPET